jgi:hypothetical protein
VLLSWALTRSTAEECAMPQNSMIPRDRDEDPVFESPEEADGSDEDFLDDLNIVLADE